METSYKVYQLMEFFINKFSYTSIVIKGMIKPDEIWLVNKSHPVYKIVRISTTTLDSTAAERSRIELYCQNVGSFLKTPDTSFLDIHVGKEESMANEAFNTLVLDTDYHSGLELNDIYPGIYRVVHEASDSEAEIKMRLESIAENLKNTRRQKRKLKLPPNFFTILISVVCIINFLIYLLMANKYSASASLIFLGADYKMFTLGANEWVRLLTHGFLHSSFSHLIFNLISLNSLGNYFERKHGHWVFLIMLLSGIVTGALCHGILAANSLTVGLSGGLYCLFAYYCIEVIDKHYYTNSNFYLLIAVNVMLNFLGGVAWQGHLGGAICGLLFYFALEKADGRKMLLTALIPLMMVVLGIKYFNLDKISPKYPGTDQEVINILNDYGFTEYAKELEYKLVVAYARGQNGK